MKKIFSYNKLGIETADALVESGYALAQAYMDGKGHTNEYEVANKEFNEKFMSYCADGIEYPYNGLEDVKNSMVNQNDRFVSRFNTILAQILTPVVPTVAAQGYEQLYDIHQVGYGVA